MSHTTLEVDIRDLVKRGFRAIEHPGSEDLVELVHAEFRNWEAVGPAAHLRGPEAFGAAVEMLNRAFSELRYEVLELIAERDLVAVRTVMHGVHTGPIRALARTCRGFAMSQSHWFRVADGFAHDVGACPLCGESVSFTRRVGLREASERDQGAPRAPSPGQFAAPARHYDRFMGR